VSDIDQRLAAAGLAPLTRNAWLEIDLDALAGNYRLMRELAGDGTEAWAVVKADAYGHGIEMAARTFVEAGAERLCVASLDEALHLRQHDLQVPLVLLFPIPPLALERAVDAGGIELAASDVAGTRLLIERWRETAGAGGGRRLDLHLEIESGLGRGGVPAAEAARLATEISSAAGVRLAGVWTHLATAEDQSACADQVRTFEAAVDSIRAAGVTVPVRHATASGALIAGHGPSYEAVRPGLALYGLMPPDLPRSERVSRVAERLRPAMQLKARPIRIETLATGSGVGYNSRWRAPRPSRIATLPLGYGDGWARAYWPGSEALVRGRRVPFVGTVAMDSIMVDLTDVAEAGLDDELVLLGRHGDVQISADDLARRRNTISWEVVTTMAQRLPRVYHARAVPVAVRTLLASD
jgi:alanine racemase